jgi:predicted signal transduction protein with EAL and GGDEF domain
MHNAPPLYRELKSERFNAVVNINRRAMNAFYVTLISFNAFCFLAILLSGIRKEQPHFIGLACINILLLSFNLLSLLLLNTTDLQRAVLLSKYHLSCLIIGIPLYYYVFGKWSKFRFTRQATIASAIICLPLLLQGRPNSLCHNHTIKKPKHRYTNTLSEARVISPHFKYQYLCIKFRQILVCFALMRAVRKPTRIFAL